MKLSSSMRMNMLGQLRTALLDQTSYAGTDDTIRLIVFRGLGTDVLCSLAFDNFIDNFYSDHAGCTFRLGDSTDLIGSVGNAGTVTRFSISGVVPGSATRTVDLITGSVGGNDSACDIKFNMLSWVPGTTVTLSKLNFAVNQGK